MSEVAYHFSWVKYLKAKYHAWRAERLFKKVWKRKESLYACMDACTRHKKRATELIDEMKL